MKSVLSFINKNKLAVFFALFLIVLAGFSTFDDSQERVSAAGGSNGSSNQGGGNEEGGNGNQVSTGDLCGFAWGATTETTASKNGAGWVSFSYKDCDLDGLNGISAAEAAQVPGCPVGANFGQYGVSVDSNRELQGYAWSSNLGWLKFGSGNNEAELGGMPNGSNIGNDPQVARVDNASGDSPLSGWARFCSGTENGSAQGNCSSNTPRSDGWDGWLSLKGNGFDINGVQNDSYGVTYTDSSRSFSGRSWGGPVVGWLRWDLSSGKGVRFCQAPTFTASLNADPNEGVVPPSVSVRLFAGSNQSGVSYSFKCDRFDPNFVPSNTTPASEHNCSYSSAGDYQPEVQVTLTSNGQTRTASDLVEVTDANTGGGGNTLGVTCHVIDVAGDYVAGSQAMVNRPVEWRADVTSDGTAPGPYNYLFEFDDNDDGNDDSDFGGLSDGDEPDRQSSDASPRIEERTYRILGRKYARVTVTDPVANITLGPVLCTPAPLSVVVNPRIIEI